MNRFKQREHIFKILFSYDFKALEGDLTAHIHDYIDHFEPAEEPSKDLILEKTHEIYKHIDDIDDRINQSAKNWTVDRMAKVELAIIRLATFEVLYDEGVPYKVAANEAVELAKKYGGEHAPKFVNGVIGSIIKKLAN